MSKTIINIFDFTWLLYSSLHGNSNSFQVFVYFGVVAINEYICLRSLFSQWFKYKVSCYECISTKTLV